MYEQRGLIAPKRSPKNTRLYSQRDVERLRRIQEMTAEGLNLAGVEMVLALESQVQRLRAEVARLRKRLEEVGTKSDGEDGGS
jgi:MerR family transcriptional regulator/heat shock protein HspR